MKIYEVTFPPLQEGILGDIGRGIVGAAGGTVPGMDQGAINKQAAKAAAGLAAQGYGPGGPDPDSDLGKALSTDWKVKLQNIQKDPAIAQYLNSLLQGWSQQQKAIQAKLDKEAAQAQAQAQAAAAQTKPAPFAGPAAPLPTVTVDGKLLTKGPDGLWHGEDGRAVTDPAQAAKLDKAYHTGMRNQKGTVKEATRMRDPNLKQRAQQRSMPGDTAAAATAPAASASPADEMKKEFLAWTDASLASRDSAYNRITMADVRSNVDGIKPELDRKLEAVVQQGYRPDVVKDYLQTAIAGIQARSQELKKRELQGDYSGAGDPTQDIDGEAQKQAQEKINKFGLGDGRLQDFGKTLKNKRARSTGNQELDALLRATGVTVS